MTELANISMPPLPVGLSSTAGSTPSRLAPTFPEPEPLKLSDDDRLEVVETIKKLYRAAVEDRAAWSKRHQDYDLMFRGQMDFRGPNAGPWDDSANLHVQMPYWAVDAYNARLVSAVWDQTPLVTSLPEEDDDIEIGRNAANLVRWHFSPKRMSARAAWERISKTRCIHGRGVALVPWAKDEYTYRVSGDTRFQRDDDGNIMVDENGIPIELSSEPILKRQIKYDGPILLPLEWDDVIEPMEGTNLQPVTPYNPLGADWVGIRQWEPLSLIWKKRDSAYTYLEEDDKFGDKDAWIDAAPSQDRSGSGVGANNQARARLQDYVEGRTRRLGNSSRSPSARTNPEFEVLCWFMPWELKNEAGDLEEAECVFFFCLKPEVLLGAYRLTDLQWHNRRPLVELDFQTVGNRRLSMGIMEIIQDLSAELDTIHNMRMDVGFFTNIPFFFYQATSTFQPDRLVLRPGKGIPVDDVRAVAFPQLQNVTSFYYQEEQLLYSLVERVLGVTDLFLGVSPTRGAAARHATGFVGTQQEALSRVQPVIAADATAFSHLCHLIYEAEIQFGPSERIVRLEGRAGPLSQRLTRNELWFRGEYDFTLGANFGLYSSMLRQQQAQALSGMAQVSPLINADPGRRWEVENFALFSYGFPDPELFIGPKSAVSSASPKAPDEEDGEMDQYIHGAGIPTPVHPSDNDAEHLRVHQTHLMSSAFMSMGRPNLQAHLAHLQATQAQMMRKQQAAQAQAMMAAEGGGEPMPQLQGMRSVQPNARNVASLEGAEQSGQMGMMPPRMGGMMSRPTNGRPGGMM